MDKGGGGDCTSCPSSVVSDNMRVEIQQSWEDAPKGPKLSSRDWKSGEWKSEYLGSRLSSATLSLGQLEQASWDHSFLSSEIRVWDKMTSTPFNISVSLKLWKYVLKWYRDPVKVVEMQNHHFDTLYWATATFVKHCSLEEKERWGEFYMGQKDRGKKPLWAWCRETGAV